MLREFLPKRDLLAYLEATLRVYNQYGRRDNIYKARIKILVHTLGIEKLRDEVEAEFDASPKDGLELPEAAVYAIARQFAPPPYADAAGDARHPGTHPGRRAIVRALGQEQHPCA